MQYWDIDFAEHLLYIGSVRDISTKRMPVVVRFLSLAVVLPTTMRIGRRSVVSELHVFYDAFSIWFGGVLYF